MASLGGTTIGYGQSFHQTPRTASKYNWFFTLEIPTASQIHAVQIIKELRTDEGHIEVTSASRMQAQPGILTAL